MKAKVELITRSKRVFRCPRGCDHDFSIDHLLGKSCSTAWFCDVCGQRWSIDVRGEEVFVEAMVHPDGEPQTLKKIWALLEVRPKTESIYFLVEGIEISECTDLQAAMGLRSQSPVERHASYYQSHTCPTNWLRRVEQIALGGDGDPHEIAELVAVYYEKPSDDRHGNDGHLAALAAADRSKVDA